MLRHTHIACLVLSHRVEVQNKTVTLY